MYTLYYLNRNFQLGTIKVENLGAPILIPEDLVFCNFRKESVFIKHPHICIDFSDTERLIIASEFTDINLLKDYDFRRQNTYLKASCTDGQDGEEEKCICKCNCNCNHEPEPEPPFVGTAILIKGGKKVCQDGLIDIKDVFEGNAYMKKTYNSDLAIGDVIYEDQACTIPISYPFVQFKFNSYYCDLTNGELVRWWGVNVPCHVNRYLSEVQLTGVNGEVITLQYIKSDGTAGQETWTVGGNGEELYYSFGVGQCVREYSVGLDGGKLIQNVWIDSITCPVV